MKKQYNFLHEENDRDILYRVICEKVKYLSPYLVSYRDSKYLAQDILNYIIDNDYEIKDIKDFNKFFDNLMGNKTFRETIWENVLDDIADVIKEDIQRTLKFDNYMQVIYQKCYNQFVENKKRFVAISPNDIPVEVVNTFKKYNMDFSKRQIADILNSIIIDNDIPIYGDEDKKVDNVEIYIGSLYLDDDDFSFEFSDYVISILEHLSDTDKEFLDNYRYDKNVTKVNFYEGLFYVVPTTTLFGYYVALKDIDFDIKYYAQKHGFIEY